MKRFLATILTISMCLSVMAFLPAVSAANENETVYDFKTDNSTLKKTTSIDPTVTGRDWYSINTRNWKGFDVSDNIKQFFDTGVSSITLYNAVGKTYVTWMREKVYEWASSSFDEINAASLRILQGMEAGLVFSPAFSWTEKISDTAGKTQSIKYQAVIEDAWFALKLDAPETTGKHQLTFSLVGTVVPPSCDIYFAPYEQGKDSGSYYIKDANKKASGITINPSEPPIVEGLETGGASHYILLIRINGENYNNKLQFAEITLTKDETVAPTTVNYGVFDNVEDSDAVTVTGGENNKLFGSVTAGTGLSATAGEKEGYTFRYWVLGSAATGRYYSSEKTVTINPYANIALTAIYTEATEDTKYLDFFNWNGEFVDSKEVTDGKVTALPTQPTLTGYSFLNWILEDNKTTFTDAPVEIPENISKAMAQYTKVGDYDKPVQNNGSVKGWTRNGELVTYSENYEFFTWLNDVGTIAAYTGEEISDEIPLAVLESDGGENFMLEYDKGAYTIKEAGILFGKTEKVNVESAYSKATAKYLEEDGHGQLTAAPEGDQDMELYARGYVMYNDKVIYTDAIAIN